MSFFLFFFLSIYSLIHFLFFLQVRCLFNHHRIAQWVLLMFVLVMIFSPVLSRVLERSGHDFWAQIIAYIAFNWMGIVFLAFFCGLAVEIVRLLYWLFTIVIPVGLPAFPVKKAITGMLIFVGMVSAYGFFEAKRLNIEKLVIKTDKLPESVDKITIAQISDVHIGLLMRESRLRLIIDKIKSLNPDILVATGDLVDGSFYHLNGLTEMFKELTPPFGKYAVTGNHEYYAGLEESVDFMQKAGFTVLRNEVRSIDHYLNIAGVDDRYNEKRQLNILSSIRNGRFTVFLKHRPDVEKETLGLFDLQLSGHTHNGQIFPWHLIVAIPFPYVGGLYDLDKGGKIYTSRGTGTWGPQIRVLSPPEITLIEIRPATP